MPNKKYSGFLASVNDPSGQTLSTSVESVFKVVIGLVGFFAVSHGLDPMTAQNQIQVIFDLVMQMIPAGYSLFHSLQMLWGLIQKALAFFLKKSPV